MYQTKLFTWFSMNGNNDIAYSRQLDKLQDDWLLFIELLRLSTGAEEQLDPEL